MQKLADDSVRQKISSCDNAAIDISSKKSQQSSGAPYSLGRMPRVAATGFSFVVFGLGTLLIQFFVLPWIYLMPRSTQDRDYRTARIRRARHLIYLSARAYVQLLRILATCDLRYEGIKHESNESLIIANHPTLLDAIFMMAVLPQVTFVVKAPLARNIFTFLLVHAADYLVNDSEETLIDDAAKRLTAGESIVIFPEATRSSDPYRPKFKRGAAHIALAAKVPVTVFCVGCYPATLQRGQSWYDVPDKRSLVVLECVEQLQLKHWQSALATSKADSEEIDNMKPGIAARKLTRFLNERQLKAIQQQIHSFDISRDKLYR